MLLHMKYSDYLIAHHTSNM